MDVLHNPLRVFVLFRLHDMFGEEGEGCMIIYMNLDKDTSSRID